jgi:hypothetical protein
MNLTIDRARSIDHLPNTLDSMVLMQNNDHDHQNSIPKTRQDTGSHGRPTALDLSLESSNQRRSEHLVIPVAWATVNSDSLALDPRLVGVHRYQQPSGDGQSQHPTTAARTFYWVS